MSENMPTNVQLENGNGSITFAADVVATIAGLAATEVEGVASMSGGSTGLADILTRRMQPARTLTKGVRVELTDHAVSVHLTIVVEYGSPVPEVAANIQENVKKAIETMSGLTVTNVDVHVQGVSFDRENRTAVELEMKQRLMLQKKQDDERAERIKADTAHPTETAEASSEPEAAEEEYEEPDEELPDDFDDEEEPLDDEAQTESAGEPIEDEPSPAKPEDDRE